MKVSEYFGIEKLTQEDLVNIQDESKYWEGAGRFVLENWDRDIDDDLTERQVVWLDKIHEEMTERRIKGKL